MYKLRNLPLGGQDIIRIIDNACIPMNEANTDYANFKTEVLAGAELQDSESQVMSQEEANQFIATLP
jgi:hypothetical protein